MKRVSLVICMLGALLGAYIGAGGWIGSQVLASVPVAKQLADKDSDVTYDGISFKDNSELKAFLLEEKVGKLFPWLFELPLVLVPLICATGFGLLGGAVGAIASQMMTQTAWGATRTTSFCAFGSGIGLMIFFLSLLVPAVFSSSSSPVRPETIAGLSMLGGVFSDKAYRWLEDKVLNNVFPAHKNKK